MNQNRLIKISVAISGVSLVVAVGTVLFALSSQSQSGPQARKLVVPEPKPLTADNPAAKIPHAEGLEAIGGVVENVSASSLVVRGNDGAQTVSLNSSTKLYSRGKQKNPVVYQKEMQVFQDTLKNAMGATDTFIAPSAYEMVEGSLSDLTPGTQVRVFVGADGVAVQVIILSGSGHRQ